jgi:D-alanyl-D-alanine carboxypeptidase
MKSILIKVLILAVFMHSCAEYDHTKTKQKVLERFAKKVNSDKKMGSALLLIHSDSLNIHWKTAVSKDPAKQISEDQPTHFASIGKTITSVMISILYEKGFIDFNDHITDYLDNDILEGIHIYKGKDYSGEILVSHLLNHTSGIADYYLDRDDSGICLMDLMLKEPDRFWTPLETVNWTKERLKPHFAPGEGFHYSDTNYQLLGFIIEKITGKPLHEALHENIFRPLGMYNTWQMFYSEPEIESPYPMVDIYHEGLNLSEAKSISIDWAGGGIVSTTEDLLKFIRALANNRIIKKETFEKMKDWQQFGPGIKYGYGLMKFRFFTMPAKYEIWGNSGSIGAFMYYNPSMDVYFIGNFHKVNCHRAPVVFIIKSLKEMNKLSEVQN